MWVVVSWNLNKLKNLLKTYPFHLKIELNCKLHKHFLHNFFFQFLFFLKIKKELFFLKNRDRGRQGSPGVSEKDLDMNWGVFVTKAIKGEWLETNWSPLMSLFKDNNLLQENPNLHKCSFNPSKECSLLNQINKKKKKVWSYYWGN